MKARNIFLIIALLLSASTFAQHNEEVTIEGSYRPTVNKVDKILMNPEAPTPSFTLPSSDVHVMDVEHQFKLDLDKMTALTYKSKDEQQERAEKNFLMAAFGTRVSPVFLYRHNSNLTRRLALGVGIQHYSSWLGIKDYAPSGFMNNAVEIGLSGNAFGNMQVGGKVYYKNDVYHYYGVKTDEWTGSSAALDHAAPRQTYNTIGTHLGMASTTTRNGEFVHDAGLDYHYLFGKLDDGGKEHFAKLDYDLSRSNNWWGKKETPQKLGVAMSLQYGHTAFAGNIGDDRLLLKLNPYLEMKDDFYRLRLGVRADVATTFESTTDLITVHPDVKGSLFVLDNTLEFYAGLNGGRKLISYSDLVSENPFVATRLNMEVTNVKLGFDGGIRTNIMNTMDVHVGVRYRHTDNDLFYRQSLAPVTALTVDYPYNSFDLVYDETRTVSVLGNIRWLALDKLTVDLGMVYNKYTLANERHAWYRPSFEADLKLDYQFNDDLAFNANFLYQGGRWAERVPTNTSLTYDVKLPDVIDLALGADYKLKDRLTVFAKADNLFHRKYQLYLDYPVTGIELFAGLKMAF